MAHRSNQAVASQEQPAPKSPDDPPPARRLLIGWTTALLALGVSTAALTLAIWLLRFPIAGFFISAALADRGADADFQIVSLDFHHLTLSNVRFGSDTSPDASAAMVEARWAWSGLTPRLAAVRVIQPRLRLRIDQSGRVSAGALDHLRAGPPGARRMTLPEAEFVIEDGQALIEAPFGAFTGTFEAAGRLGHNFSAVARIDETSQRSETHVLEDGSAELILISRDGVAAGRLLATVGRLVWNGAEITGAQVRLSARAPLDLSRYTVEATWRVSGLEAPNISGAGLSGAAGGEAIARADSIDPAEWQAQARAQFGALTASSHSFAGARLEARAEGREATGAATWTLAADRYAGLAMISERANASGRITFGASGPGNAAGDAQISLAQTRLNAGAQDNLRDAFPDLGGSPVGPTFARARSALDAAADRFDLTVPITFEIEQRGFRVEIAEPAQARAATGAVLRLAPLRSDAPALVVQSPELNLHGAVALELSGGGAPSAALLLDTLDWAPEAPFEADGTLTVDNWRADNASIAARDLGISIIVSPGGGGRVDLRGPGAITGPVGDGEVRDMVAALDVAVSWSAGWRVATNSGCLPVRLGGLDAAGLSFNNGAFALCPLEGALIAADANSNLSGGFSIQDLALNGRMGGAEGQPARVNASTVTGRFRGRTGNVSLLVEAQTPGISVAMDEGRTLAITMQRATADARFGGDTWRVEGAFESGILNDPSLPGTVSTIAGRWSAAPEHDEAVIRVTAGEALLTAHEPASIDQRPLFNPMQLADVDAVFRGGELDAEGQIVLAQIDRQLAQFTAHHDVDTGAGAARIAAPTLTFGETLQPYHISERARGAVANVRGPASAIADVAWTRDALTATGTLSAQGVSMATATLPVIEDVRGDIYFDNLFELTTPPGQVATVGLLNPGLAVRNGRLQFQLLSEQRVSVERAEFEFAGGILAMSPTTVRLGQDETRIELTLRDVQAADLIANLGIPDLAATGQVRGSFPLRLTRQTAYIEHGVLRAQGGGGLISYTGNAGADATGATRLAFDALRRFAYDELTLTLDGDINGEVVSAIEFSGRNAGDAVSLGEIAPVPGLGDVTVRGVPFDFNVRVTAPFRALAQTAASITDPGEILNRGRQTEVEVTPEPAEPVDQGGPGTR